MRPADLCNYPSSWFSGGPDAVSDIVISSRIRLARNVAGYEFLPCLSLERQQQLHDRLKEALLSIDLGEKVWCVDIDHDPFLGDPFDAASLGVDEFDVGSIEGRQILIMETGSFAELSVVGLE